MSIHFPFIEAGRVRPICGEPRTEFDWATKPHVVTCPHCQKLLCMDAEPLTARFPTRLQTPNARMVTVSSGWHASPTSGPRKAVAITRSRLAGSAGAS